MFLAYIDLKDINQWINVSSTYISSSPSPPQKDRLKSKAYLKPQNADVLRLFCWVGPTITDRCAVQKVLVVCTAKRVGHRVFSMQGRKASNRLPTHKSCWKEWASLLNPPKKSKISKMKWLWSDLNWYHQAASLSPILKSQSKSDKSDHGIPRVYSPRIHQMIHVTFATSNWPPLTLGHLFHTPPTKNFMILHPTWRFTYCRDLVYLWSPQNSSM